MDPAPAHAIGACFVCFAPARFRCGRCRAAWYCGPECQQRDWQKHKEACGRAAVRVLKPGALWAEYRPAAGARHYITKGGLRGLLEDYRGAVSLFSGVDPALLGSAPYGLGEAGWHDHWVRALKPAELEKLSGMCRAWSEAHGGKLPDL